MAPAPGSGGWCAEARVQRLGLPCQCFKRATVVDDMVSELQTVRPAGLRREDPFGECLVHSGAGEQSRALDLKSAVDDNNLVEP